MEEDTVVRLQVIEAEVDAAHAELEDGHGRRRLVRPAFVPRPRHHPSCGHRMEQVLWVV
jgi:hypothetical protein